MRHDLYETITTHWGEPRAEAMMNPLPPVAWADVATKQDLAHLESRIDRLEARMDRLGHEIQALKGSFITWLLTSQATVVAVVAALSLR